MPNSGSASSKRTRDVNRTHVGLSPSDPRRGSLAVIEDREKSLSRPYGRQWYLRRGLASRHDMVSIGPRKGHVKMIRLADVPRVKEELSNLLRILGPDHLVPENPLDPKAERTVAHSYSWGEMQNIAVSSKKAAKADRQEKEAKDSKRAKAKSRKMG